MSRPLPSRRTFLAAAGCVLGAPRAVFEQAPVTRPDLAAIDRERILAAAERALGRTGADLLTFTLDVPALAAACHLQPERAETLAAAAAGLLERWFVAPSTRLDPAPTQAAIAERAALAEVVVALPFLPLGKPLYEALDIGLATWLRKALTWLTEDRAALLIRDARDHQASAWLLTTAAFARHVADEAILVDCRHRFQTVTLRAQIAASGLFPHELTGPAPFRDSLFNLDLLAGAVHLLSTRFDSLWDRELQDGPGMRVAIARHAAYIAAPVTWPYPADPAHFHALPGRRPALLFAARAYNQAEYATLWRSLNADPDILATFPIRQPILWVQQPRRQSTG